MRELYQELIIDHGRSPRNFGKLDPADSMHEGFNPLCGDKIIIYFKENAGKIAAVKFEGCGCAISMASASMMTEVLVGKTSQEVAELFAEFHALVTTGVVAQQAPQLEKLQVLAGVSEFPMRVKCATLAWHTALAALNKEVKI